MSDTANDDLPTRRNWISFWSLLSVQTQNAFNDKAAQFLLIPLAGALVVAAKKSGQDVGFLGDHMEHVLGALIVLPFILFAPLSGWLSDRFSKTHVIRATLCMQLVVFALLMVAIMSQHLGLAVLGFFLLSVESVLLSPAKKGIVKELVGHSRLGFASGVLEMSVIMAVCFGQIISGWWYDARRLEGYGIWEAGSFPMMVVGIAALVSLMVSFGVEKVKPMGKRPFRMKLLFEHFEQLQELWSDRRMRLSGVGIAFFWGFAGFINLTAIQIGKDLSGGGGVGFGSETSWLMLAASGGIALGGVMGSLICKKRIELGLVPLGGIVMIVGSMALAIGPVERSYLMTWMAISGGGGALLLVPLNAYLQDICPPEKRGRVLAGLNLLDCLAGFLAVAVQFLMSMWKLPYSIQFGSLALVSLVVTCYSARVLPQHFVRFIALSIFKSIYRVRTMNVERVPETGGVLVTPNHVSYIDAFILSVACPRPIRFLLFDEYFTHPLVGRFVRLFDAVPISPARAKDGMRIAAEALKAGSVVCIFPEGQLTRTGGMNPFMRGFEMIARRAGCPVLPTAMDGVWGSIFSFERNCFLNKKPYSLQYGVSVNFGEPLAPKQANGESLRRQITQLRSEAFASRFILKHPGRVFAREVEVIAGNTDAFRSGVKELRAYSAAVQTELLANVLQMAELNAIQRRQKVMLDWDALSATCRDVVALAMAHYFELKLVLVDAGTDAQERAALAEQYSIETFVGGAAMAEAWRDFRLPGGCYDFSERAAETVGEGIERTVFPCMVASGRVVSMSMAHPRAQTTINAEQAGYSRGAWGWLLPGFEVVSDDQGILLKGPSLPGGQLELNGFELNNVGMLSGITKEV